MVREPTWQMKPTLLSQSSTPRPTLRLHIFRTFQPLGWRSRRTEPELRRRMHVGNNNTPMGVSVIDTATNIVVTHIPITNTGVPVAIAITPAPQAPKARRSASKAGI